MAFAIMRTAKITTIGNLAGSASHNFRERETLNADPALTKLNYTSGARSTKQVIDVFNERLSEIKARKNAVICVEYFFGASPEWFKTVSHNQREEYFNSCEKWLREKHGSENVISFTRQYDETSPHVCAYVLPVADGKLNASKFLDGRKKLTEMQTDFHQKAAKRFGLERGIEGSKAKHQTVKRFYSLISSSTPASRIKIPPKPIAGFFDKLSSSFGVETKYSNNVKKRELILEQKRKEDRAALEVLKSKSSAFDVSDKSRKDCFLRSSDAERELKRLKPASEQLIAELSTVREKLQRVESRLRDLKSIVQKSVDDTQLKKIMTAFNTNNTNKTLFAREDTVDSSSAR
ncbi:MobV family relaxase, partial [Ferrovum myxofaciens]|uniref:MobV family relaxase n=1 Tax=Ferrovum myxofaciens TaxID=416213 RepID=UPI0018D2B617